jgi:hypothetical protein
MSKGWPAYKADLSALCEPIAWKMDRLDVSQTFTASYRDRFIFFYLYGDEHRIHDLAALFRSEFQNRPGRSDRNVNITIGICTPAIQA